MATTLCGQAPPVPSEYQDLYSMMQSQISTFDQTILQSWDRSRPPVAFSTHLGSVNSNVGASLLDPNHYSAVLLEMDGIKATGVKAVSLSIDYPTLDPAFDAYGGQAANFLAFYKQVASDIRARGMKVIIETGPLFTQSGFPHVDVMPFYTALTTAQYNLGRANQALLIAQQIAPDYLSVIEEPDTEATQTGKPELGTVSGSTMLLNQILTVYRQSGTTVPVGAGVGTWTTSYDQYIKNFTATSLDYIDIHIYPVNKDYLTRALTIVSMASAAGKRVAMSEMWGQKIRDYELLALPQPVAFSRDDFSFWAPLDTQFLQAMVDFSYSRNLLFAAAFEGGCFRGYIDYDSNTSTMNFVELNNATFAIQSANILDGVFATTGTNWKQSILGFNDVTPPATPQLTLTGALPNLLSLTWPVSSDNVGTAGYYVYRDGAPVNQTALGSYTDSSVKDGLTYRYTVSAFDLSGNVSALSATLTVTTPDITPPTVPKNLRVTAKSSTGIDLAWAASTDNVGVASYRIYRGSTPTSLALRANSTTTAYADTALRNGTTFCYAVAAVDVTWLASAQSPPVCATVPDATPPSIPTKLIATAISSTQVKLSWNASNDNVGVTGYQVQRAVGMGSPVVIGTAATTAYTDSTAQPNTKYTYKVLAYDAAGNKSGLSAGARVTTSK